MSALVILLHVSDYFLLRVAKKHCLVMIIYTYLAVKSDAELTIKADPSSPSYGQNVTITCDIPSFDDVASFIRGDSGVILTNCISMTGKCSPQKVDRYTFGATSTSVFVVISGVDISNDSFLWKCQYGSKTVNLTLVFNNITTTTVAPSSADNTTTTTVIAAVGGALGAVLIVFVIYKIKKKFQDRCLTGRKKDDSPKEQDTDSSPDPSPDSIRCLTLEHSDFQRSPSTLSTDPLLP